MGQQIWNSRGADDSEYVVTVETEKNIAYEYRRKSAFGKLASDMSETTQSGQADDSVDVGTTAVIWTKEISEGDEVRFTLEQNMYGSPTFGDAEVRTGNYLAYLHQNIYLNKLDTPAIPLQEEMSRQRAASVIKNPESRIRRQLTMYFAEQYSFDCIEAILKGSSMNLRAPENIGGRALNLGLGAGIQVSPEHIIVAGTGIVSGTPGTAAYEVLVAAAFDNLDKTDTDHRISRGFIQEVRDAIDDLKIKGTPVNGKEKWYVPIDTSLLTRITKYGGELATLWAASRERAKSNPGFGYDPFELDDFIFLPEPYLKKYRPDETQAAASVVQWGPQVTYDPRNVTSTSSIMLAMILGEQALLEAHKGAVDVTMEKGRHGKGKELAGHVRQSFQRSRWTPKDGRTGITLNQSSVLLAFADPGNTFGV
jgi:hypothetical protein